MALFLQILTIVLPVFSVMGLGYALKRLGLIDNAFLYQTNRLVYYVCLPILLFYKIGTADFFANFNAPLVIGSVAAIILTFIFIYAYAALMNYSPAVRGAFVQGAFRGNLAYVGLAITFNAYGEIGLTKAGILMGFVVPFLNLFAILALIWPHKDGNEGRGPGFWVRQIAFNPLILACFIGIVWSFFQIPMPLILKRSLDIASGMALPLALIAIGGSFSLAKLKGDLFKAGLASAVKLIWLPLFTVAILILLGVRGMDLGIGVLIAATPAATATYIMAHQLKGDAELAGAIVMMSTLLSAFTYTIALFILRTQGI